MPAGNETWNVRDEDAKRVLAEDAYDDCTACKVTGIYMPSSASFIVAV